MTSAPSPSTDPSAVAPPSSPPRRVHPFNTLFGLVFLAAAGTWFAHEQGGLGGAELGRVVAVALIVLGALGLVATVVVTRRGRARVAGPAPVRHHDDGADEHDA